MNLPNVVSAEEWEARTTRRSRSTAAIRSRRTADDAMEGPDEVREILESDVVRDLGDGTMRIAQESRREADAGAEQILMGRRPGHPSEDAQEVKWAEPDGARNVRERQRLPTRTFDEIHRVSDAADVARMRRDLECWDTRCVCEYRLHDEVANLVEVRVIAKASPLDEHFGAWQRWQHRR